MSWHVSFNADGFLSDPADRIMWYCGAALTRCKKLQALKSQGLCPLKLRNIYQQKHREVFPKSLCMHREHLLFCVGLVVKIFCECFVLYIKESRGEGEGGAANRQRMHSTFFCLDILENILFQMLIQISLLVNCSFVWFMSFVMWLINN